MIFIYTNESDKYNCLSLFAVFGRCSYCLSAFSTFAKAKEYCYLFIQKSQKTMKPIHIIIGQIYDKNIDISSLLIVLLDL